MTLPLTFRSPRRIPLVSLWVAAAALLSAMSAGSETDDPPACRVAVEARPSRAVVGQQIVYTARIVRRDDVVKVEWLQALSFPDFRSERLPGRSERRRNAVSGCRLLGPARSSARSSPCAREPSRSRVPASAASWAVAGPSAGTTERVDLPSLVIPVDEPPEEGRPSDFDGAVGPLVLQTRADPLEVSLGESVRVSVLVQGSSDLWNLASPTEHAVWGRDLEVFHQPSEVRVESGDRLYLREVSFASISCRESRAATRCRRCEFPTTTRRSEGGGRPWVSGSS